MAISGPPVEDIQVRLVPGVRIYLVYRRGRDAAPAPVPQGFAVLSSPFAALRCLAALRHAWGARRLLVAVAKLATPRRFLFCVIRDGRLAAHGWLNVGFCRLYDIERDACVIGPIHTEPQWRGRGLIVESMLAAVEWLGQRGCEKFYIDAHVDNRASLRAILKAGFEGPIAAVPNVPRAAR